MGKGKMFRIYKRSLAFLLAVVLMVSSLPGMSMTAYAAEDIVISDVDLQETEGIEEIIEETGEEPSSVEEEPTAAPEATEEPASAEASAQEPESTEEPAMEPEGSEEPTAEPAQESAVEESTVPEETQEPVEGDEEELSEQEITEITPDAEVPYIGDSYDGHLDITYEKMEEAGIEFTDENLISILEANAGTVFEHILIEYPSIPGVVNVAVWNAIAAISDDVTTINIKFFDLENAYRIEWNIQGITDATADVELAADFAINDEGEATVVFENTQISAEEVSSKILFEATNADISAWKEIFADDCELVLKTVDGAQVTGVTGEVYYLNENSIVSVNVYDVRGLTSGETYILTEKGEVEELTYIGTYDAVNKSLFINASDIAEAYGEFTEESIIDILNYRLEHRDETGEKFGYIEIAYDQVKETISKDVWNAAVELYTEENTEIGFAFPVGTAHEKDWAFVNPAATEEDVDVSTEITINGAGGGMTITVGNTEFPASSAVFVPYASAEMSDNATMKNAFYQWGENYWTVIRDEEGNEVEGGTCNFIVRDDDSARLLFVLYDNDNEGVTPLSADTTYTVLTPYAPYGGHPWPVEDGSPTGLDIILSDIGRDSITPEEIHRIMAENGDAKFDEILIEYPFAETAMIPADVLNAMREYLQWSEDHEQWLRINFNDREAQKCYEWRLLYPQEQTEDKTVEAIFNADSENGLTVKVSGANFGADRVDLSLDFGSENPNMEVIKDCLGEEGIPLKVGDLDTNASYINYGEHVNVYLENVNTYDSETVYPLADNRYFGEVQDDRLFIDYREFWDRGQDASNEAFTELLKSYEGQKFTAVHLTVPAGEDDRVCVVNKNVYNAARKLLATNGEGIYYNFNHEERNVLWFISKGKALSKNQTLKYDVYINEYGQPALKLTLPKKEDMGGAAVSLAVELLKGSGPAEDMLNYMGEPFAGAPEDEIQNIRHRLFPLGNVERPVKWVESGEEKEFLKLAFMNDLYALSNNKEYVILEYFPGWVNDEWGRELGFSNYDLGRKNITASELKEALRYYAEEIEKGNMERFTRVGVQQPFVSGKNTIRKSDINFLSGLLIEEPGENGRGLGFTFCKCTYNEETDTPYTCDYNWNIDNPGTFTKDIDANVTPKVSSQGVSVTFGENSYKADDVRLQIRVSQGVEFADKMADVLGGFEEEGKELAVLKKKGLALTNIYADCWNDTDGNVYNLHLCNLAKYAADTEYLVAPIIDLREDAESRLFVQDNGNNLAKIKTQETPDTGTLSWSSADTSILRIAANGTSVEALNEGDVMYRASYKAGGVSRLEVYKNFVERKLQEMQFSREEIRMELPEDLGAWNPQDYLSIRFYPSNAGKDYNDLDWEFETIEGENVIEQIISTEMIETDEDGNPIEPIEVERFYGGIRALNPGKVKVTVTDPVTELTATCTVVVEPALTVPEGEYPYAYFIAGVDATLETAVIVPAEDAKGSWRFKNPAMSTAPFTNMDIGLVNAIYTDEYGRELERMIDIHIMKVERIEISGYVEDANGDFYDYRPELLWDKETAFLNIIPDIRNGNAEKLAAAFERGVLDVKWSSDPAGIGSEGESNRYSFTADLDHAKKGAGKKTITAKLVNTKTGATIAKTTHTITVVEKGLTDWNRVREEWQASSKKGQVGEKGTLIIYMPKDNYSKLTFTSLDEGVCKLGPKDKIKVDKTSDPDYVLTKIPYEIKGRGYTYIRLQSSDEIKSDTFIYCGSVDLTPNYVGEQILLNNRANESVSGFSVVTNFDVRLASLNAEDYTLAGEGAEYFEICNVYPGYNANATYFDIKLIDKKAPKGTYTLTLKNVETVWETEGEELARESFDVKISVKVTDTTPTYTFDQTEAVNLFYTDDEANGIMYVSGSVGIEELQLADCDYEIMLTGHYESATEYVIAVKDGTQGKDKEGKFTYKIPGYDGVYSKKFEVDVETKAPTLVLSATKDTLYPNSNLDYTGFAIYDKKTNDGIEISKIEWIKNAGKKQYVALPVGGDFLENAIKKSNSYDVSTYGNFVDFVINGESKMVKATDKLEFRVWEANWKSPVKVTYSISTVLTAPTVELSKSTITLNVNEAVYQNQSANVRASLKGMTRPDVDMNIWFAGKDAKSRKILHNNFVLETWGENGDIWARFNARNKDDRPATGNYKFDVKVEALDKVYTKTLTVKIIDEPVKKCLTVKKSGSIDVLDRDNTAVYLKPTLSNVSGKVVHGWLEGADSELFSNDYENGKLVIKAYNYQPLLVDYGYKVQPVFQVEGPNGEYYEIRGSVQTIKLTQGKVKFALMPMRSALFRDADNQFELFVNATSAKNNYVEIADIRLLNYTNDLDYWYDDYRFCVSQKDLYQMCAKNKTYKLKMEVVFAEQGGNMKSQTITYKLKLK